MSTRDISDPVYRYKVIRISSNGSLSLILGDYYDLYLSGSRNRTFATKSVSGDIYELPDVTLLNNLPNTGTFKVGGVVDDVDGGILFTYEDETEEINNLAKYYPGTSGYSVIISGYGSSVSSTYPGVPLLMGQYLNMGNRWLVPTGIKPYSGYFQSYPAMIENGDTFKPIDYTTGPVFLEVDQDYPIIEYPARQSYLLSGYAMYDIIPSGLYTDNFRLGYPSLDGYQFNRMTAVLPWNYYFDTRAFREYSAISGTKHMVIASQYSGGEDSNVQVVYDDISEFSSGIYTTFSGQVQALETTNSHRYPYMFASVSGTRYNFYQKDGSNDMVVSGFIDRTNNLPDARINVIRCDDLL